MNPPWKRKQQHPNSHPKRMTAYHAYHGKRHILRNLIVGLILFAAISYGVLEGIVLAGSHDEIRGEPGIMIILGAKVMPWEGPSVLLQDRLDTALDYLEEHPDMTVVVSGGQGSNEPISEAQCMHNYLVEHGIPEEQIRMEDQSHNTWQNLKYSNKLLAEAGYDVTEDIVVVSNGFHLARTRMLFGRMAGQTDSLSTLAAPSSHRPSAVKSYLREPLALVKSFVLDR